MGKLFLVSNSDEEVMYNELFGFKEWYSKSFNLLTFKLEKGINLDTSAMMHFFDSPRTYEDVDYDMNGTKINVNAYLVRRGNYSYEIYIPNKYVFHDFCREILKETWFHVKGYMRVPYRDEDRRKEILNVEKVFNEARKWIRDNHNTIDCWDEPYVGSNSYSHDSDKTYGAKFVLRTFDEKFVEKISKKFNDRVEKAQKKAYDTETSWMRSTYNKTYILLEVSKQEFKHETKIEEDDE